MWPLWKMTCLCRSKKNFSFRKGIDVCLCTQTYLGRHCRITACSLKFYVDLSVGKQWPQTKGQWSYIQTLALAHQLPGILINPYSFQFSSAFAVPFEAQHLVIALKMLSALFCSTWDAWMEIYLPLDNAQNTDWTNECVFLPLISFLRDCVFLVSMRRIIGFICLETQ